MEKTEGLEIERREGGEKEGGRETVKRERERERERERKKGEI